MQVQRIKEVIYWGTQYLVVRYVFSGGLCVYCDLRNSLRGIGDQRTPVFSSFIELAGKVVFTLVLCGVWLLGSHLDRTGHMDLHGDPTDRDGSRKPGLFGKQK